MTYNNQIMNPIISGFNPDPNILKVNEDYYLVVSTFEWSPGIRLYHSTDLIRWTHLTDLLTDQVDLRGNPDNCSIWAPQISYDNGLFYLVYTNVRSTRVPFKDCHNYLMTSTSIEGPWSKPIYMNSSGFDPSLFHDADGKKWFLNALWDYRMGTRNKSCGIVLQRYDEKAQKLVGEVYKIFDGTELAKTEAPHIYFKDDYYYLITAEGGTESEHSVIVCRSKSITGPYTLDPNGVMLTASDKPESTLQCTGHGSIVQGPTGKWFMVYLCTRPIQKKYAILGRETAIQEVVWTEDRWLRLSNGDTAPEEKTFIESFEKIDQNFDTYFIDDFTNGLRKEWNGRRQIPNSEWCFITDKNALRVISGESLQSAFNQSLLAIRQKDFIYEAIVKFCFKPKTYNQMAGLTIYLDENNYLFGYLTWEEKLGNVLRIMKSQNGIFILEDIKIPYAAEDVTIKYSSNYLLGQFYYEESGEWIPFGEQQDVSFLCGGYTGSYIGISVQNLDVFKGNYADFYYFEYKNK